MSDSLSPEDLESFPLTAHFLELRHRVIRSLVAILVGFGVCYYFSTDIFNFLIRPLAQVSDPDTHRLIYTGPAEAFMVHIQLAVWGGVILALPVIASQLWAFLAPGLYKNERLFVRSLLLAVPVLFTLGAAMAYGLVFPLAWKFFLSFEVPLGQGPLPIQMEARVSEYLSLATGIIFGFGIAFQLPVVLILLARAGVVTADQLAKFRRFAIVLIFAAAAILTPPDAISQICLALPMTLLYELSIWGARWAARSRQTSS